MRHKIKMEFVVYNLERIVACRAFGTHAIYEKIIPIIQYYASKTDGVFDRKHIIKCAYSNKSVNNSIVTIFASIRREITGNDIKNFDELHIINNKLFNIMKRTKIINTLMRHTDC